MKRLSFILLLLAIVPFLLPDKEPKAPAPVNSEVLTEPAVESTSHTITGIVQSRETLDSIFGKHKLNKADLNKIYFTSKKQFNLSKISIGSVYSFELDKDKMEIQKMQFGIDDSSFLNVERSPEGFTSTKVDMQYEKRTGSFYIDIQGNLISSMPGTHREYNRIAMNLSDIYAWDIDFSNDIRNGDSVKIIVEEIWAGDAFKGYGDILAAEFSSNGKVHKAYKFEDNGYTDYYDAKGKSLRKALLRSPLKFKYISSKFTKRRLHPKLKIYRPHLGVDYAAKTGTPVSAAGSGQVVFAGNKGQMGKMVRIKHPGGYETYYGHLSRIPRNMRKGTRVSQGDIIGFVGSTGLSTGPHLDYRIKFNGRFVNPLTIKLPRGTSITKNVIAEFKNTVDSLDPKLDSLIRPIIVLTDKTTKTSGS
jgi:murein DD-endopeptidase MepM/ murein hydrolase activator NlpD